MPYATHLSASAHRSRRPRTARPESPIGEQDRGGNRRAANRAANEERASFIRNLKRNYLESFEKRFADQRPDQDRHAAMKDARNHFEALAGALQRWAIHQTAYGDYDEGDRQAHVEAFYEEVAPLLRSLGPLAAEGQTLLWSNFGIGRFATEHPSIREAAGLTEEAQPLGMTPFGKLLDEILLTTDPEAGERGVLWAHQLQIWNAASLEFARQSRGDVHVFVPEMISSQSVFWNVELQEIRRRAAQSNEDREVYLHRLTPKALKDVMNLGVRLQMIDEAIRRARDSNDYEDLLDERERVLQMKIDRMSDRNAWLTVDIMDADIAVPTYKNEGSRGVITGQTLRKYLRKWQNKAEEARKRGGRR